MKNLIKKASKTHILSKSQIIDILSDSSINNLLFETADKVRENFVGNDVHLRGLIEFSNICKQNCKYCGIRKDNITAERYRLSKDEIIDFGKKAVGYGYKTLVLQSGEDSYFSVDKMVEIIKELKKFDIALTLSIGEKSYDEYKAYKNAGADRYLIRIETTDSILYENMHPNMSHKNRFECLENLKRLEFETGSGSLVGLPNQTIDSLADDILFFKSLDADMIGIGPFIADEHTPLKDCPNGDFTLSLKVMALTRILLPDINIPATTAMETLNPEGRLIALQSGANVVMPNVTEGDYRKKYVLYPGKICTSDTPEHCRGCISGKIKSINRTISDSKGFRKTSKQL